ncbi:hypothetical protein BGZ89_010129 [Linnemannia elongata]|nr:hypothetical protein BGZ89_010129 [Linnemannia elongata]
MSGERGHFVTFGIIASSSPSLKMLIIDAQPYPEYGRLLLIRVKALNIPLKTIYITHGHDTWRTARAPPSLPGDARNIVPENAKKAHDHILKSDPSVVPGHLDERKKNGWTTKEMVKYPNRYVEMYNRVLEANTTDKFWDGVMKECADSRFLFLLDWSSARFYESKCKALVFK